MIAADLNRDGVPSPLMYRREKHTDGGRGWKTADAVTYWTGESVRRIIRDERYTGCLVAHRRTVSELSTKKTKPVPKEEWIVVENTHEAVVTKEIFNQAQQALKEPLPRNVRRPYQKFRGLLKCACCKKTLQRNRAKKSYYVCPTQKTVAGRACADIRLEEAVLEETLLTAVQIQIQLFQNMVHEKDTAGILQEEIKACQSANSRYKALQTALFEDYAEGRIDRQKYLLKKQELLLQQEETKTHFEELASQLAQLQGQQEKTNTDLGKYTCVNELTREMLEELVKEIRVSGKDTLEIKWKFKDSFSKNDEENQ